MPLTCSITRLYTLKKGVLKIITQKLNIYNETMKQKIDYINKIKELGNWDTNTHILDIINENDIDKVKNVKENIQYIVEENIVKNVVEENIVKNVVEENIVKNVVKDVKKNVEDNVEKEKTDKFNIKNSEGLEYLSTIENNSIDLILTDPPYIISKETGMNSHYNMVKDNDKNGIEYIKNDKDWEEYIKDQKNDKININNKEYKTQKENYLKYGSIYGKKYCVKTDYGKWDNDFTMDTLNRFIKEYYLKLKKGGTCIIFFDIWKISYLKEVMESAKFKQIRFIEWIKTNPQPLNSKTNYLTNCREIALLGVKCGKPTFNSKYDNAIYKFPIQGGKDRFHPTQKSILLFEELIKKHSNEGDIVLDTFLGGGTTAIASKNTDRLFKGCELSKEYYDKIIKLIN